MICSLQQDGSLVFQEIDAFLAELIILPFLQKELSSKIINGHLFKKLTEQNSLATHDWKAYVAPELQTLFSSCHEQVMSDLAVLQQGDPSDHTRNFTISVTHRDAWLRMLSIVRLSLASQHHITKEEFPKKDPISFTELKQKALLQMEIFAVIQQCLIEAEE